MSRTAAPTATSSASASPRPMNSHVRRIRDRISPVGESRTTTATTSPSRTTGEATTTRPSRQGQTCGGSCERRPSSASLKAVRPSPSAGRVQKPGALARARSSRKKTAGADVVHRGVELQVGLEGTAALLAVRGGVGDGLRQGGETCGVVDPVDHQALLLGGGHADREREAEGEQDGGHQDDEQREQTGAHRETYPPVTRTARRAGSRRPARSRSGRAAAAWSAGRRRGPPGCVRCPPSWCARPR